MIPSSNTNPPSREFCNAMVPTTINGRWVVQLPDYRAERTEWSDPGWEVQRLDSMHANLKPGDVVYDVGTEEGDLTALYALWGCRLVLVEPNPRVWPNVKAIWEANIFQHPLAWWEGFATNTDAFIARRGFGTEGWPASADGALIRAHGFSSLREHLNQEEAGINVGGIDAVPRIRLDRLAELVGTPPDAITIDVEGAEMRVLEGATRLLTEARPLVWVSVHSDMLQYDYDSMSEKVHLWMRQHDYRQQILECDHECHWLYWHKDRTDVILP